MPTKIKSFTNLMAALNAFDARDLCSGLAILVEDDTDGVTVDALETATAAIECAETVETMSDFVANLREAITVLAPISRMSSDIAFNVRQISTEIERLLARCA